MANMATDWLTYAAEGNLTELQNLIRQGFDDVNCCDRDGNSALALTTKAGNIDCATFLIQQPNIDPNTQNNDGETALMRACRAGSDSIPILLSHPDINVNLVNKDGRTPLMVAARAKKHQSIASLLVHGHAVDVDKQDESGWTALLLASRIMDNYEVMRLLVEDFHADVNIANEGNQTPLMRAAWAGFIDYAKLLVENGATVNIQSKTGETALYWSLKQGGPDIAHYLLFEQTYDPVDHWDQAAEDAAKAFPELQFEVLRRKMGNKMGERVSMKYDDIIRDRSVAAYLSSQFITNISLFNSMHALMLTSLRELKPISNDILHGLILAEKYFSENPPPQRCCGFGQTIPDTTIVSALTECIRNGLEPPITHIFWSWFSFNLLSSSIWFEKIDSDEVLFESLLQQIDSVMEQERITLKEEAIGGIAREKEWPVLVGTNCSDIVTNKIRQDEVKDGIELDINREELKVLETQTFNSEQFYNLHVHLNRILLVAHAIDDEFQEYIESVYKKMCNENRASFHRGHLKSVDRCKEKVETEYFSETFPQCNKLLDVVRCSLAFESCGMLLDGLDILRHQVTQEDSPIVEIARVKNGFAQLDLLNDGLNYTDIKANVVYRSEKHRRSMIVEIQFILRPFLNAKKRMHRLYAVQRLEPFLRFANQMAQSQSVEQLLWQGVRTNNLKIISRALTLGADPNNQKAHKETPLIFLAKQNWDKAMELILSVPSVDVNARDANNLTALTYALDRESYACVNLLQEKDAVSSTLYSSDTERQMSHLSRYSSHVSRQSSNFSRQESTTDTR